MLFEHDPRRRDGPVLGRETLDLLTHKPCVDGRRVDKAGALVEPTAEIEIRGRSPYVSRGGEKLAHALDDFGVTVRGRICIDVGASTGGFTDCLLQRGATRVYAVDVGSGQLDDKLRRDNRVVVMENTNARGLDPRIFGDKPSLAVVDVAFISLEKVLPAVFGVLERIGETVALVKKQTDARKVLVLSDSFDENTYRSARNVKPVLLATAANVNAEQLLAFDKILITPAALEHLAERMNRE